MIEFYNPSTFFPLALLVLTGGFLLFVIYRKQHPQMTSLKRTFKRRHAAGIIFGKKGLFYYFSPSFFEGHCAILGGTGTGKTSAILIPTLRAWQGSSFTFDISGDIASNIPGSKIIYEPLSSASVPYDLFAPIDALDDDADILDALEQLAFAIMPEKEKAGDASDYFYTGGRDILTSALIWGYFSGMDFVEICESIAQNSYKSLFYLIDQSNNKDAIIHINQFDGNNEKNISGCYHDAAQAIKLFASNRHLKATLRRPVVGEKAITCRSVETDRVFVLIPDARLEIMAPLMRIITAQLLNYLADRPAKQTASILLALDEFVSLGKIDITPALRKLRKKRVRIMILTQSVADLDSVYGRDARMAMLNNVAYKVVLSAGDTESQRYFADLIGQEDKQKVSTTKTSALGKSSQTITTERRYIYDPSALATLGKNLILLYPEGHVELRKKFFYK